MAESQVNALSLIILPFGFKDDRATLALLTFFFGFAYAMHMLLARGAIRLSARGLQGLFAFYYLLVVMFRLSPWMPASPDANIQRWLAGCEFASIVCFVDATVHVSAQVAWVQQLALSIPPPRAPP